MLDNDRKIMESLIERLPSPIALRMFSQLRQSGWNWEDIEARLDGLTGDIEQSDMPFSNEAERYVRRLMLAAHATEVRGANN